MPYVGTRTTPGMGISLPLGPGAAIILGCRQQRREAAVAGVRGRRLLWETRGLVGHLEKECWRRLEGSGCLAWAIQPLKGPYHAAWQLALHSASLALHRARKKRFPCTVSWHHVKKSPN